MGAVVMSLQVTGGAGPEHQVAPVTSIGDDLGGGGSFRPLAQRLLHELWSDMRRPAINDAIGDESISDYPITDQK
jgi:hypothetical protein